MTRKSNRHYFRTLPNGLKLYRVQLVNGPAHGGQSICSGDVVWQSGARYVRGDDDRYYYTPEVAIFS